MKTAARNLTTRFIKLLPLMHRTKHTPLVQCLRNVLCGLVHALNCILSVLNEQPLLPLKPRTSPTIARFIRVKLSFTQMISPKEFCHFVSDALLKITNGYKTAKPE